jgi:hypothetical protein
MGEIPAEGECTACAGVTFQIRPITDRPTLEEYGKTLQREFERHLKYVHARDANLATPKD